MGGCRCTYRKCTSSTAGSPGLHYFHFPVKDPTRCEKWIENARKPAFRELEKDRLRNKVVCSLHFEERCFTNEKRDRLVHNAVPTLGFEEDDKIDVLPNTTYETPNDDIMLIPVNDDNTKFTLPNVEFSGVSYTIFDDAVIPTSKIEDVIINELQSNPVNKIKDIHVKTVVKKIKTNLTIPNNKPKINNKKIKTNQKIKIISDISNYKEQLQHTTAAESVLYKDDNIISSEIMDLNNITSYSVSACNGDVSVEPSTLTHIIPDMIEQFTENISNSTPVETANISNSVENIPFQNEADYNMPVTPVSLIQSFKVIDNKDVISEDSNMSLDNNQKTETVSNNNITAQNTDITSEEKKPPKIREVQQNYVKMIKHNTKQINNLKKLFNRQTKLNQMLWHQKQINYVKRKRKLRKTDLIANLKKYLKPSLLAIIKLELLPQDDIVLTEKEEKFISEFYTENSECYNILRNKYGWNLPASEKNNDSTTMECNNS